MERSATEKTRNDERAGRPPKGAPPLLTLSCRRRVYEADVTSKAIVASAPPPTVTFCGDSGSSVKVNSSASSCSSTDNYVLVGQQVEECRGVDAVLVVVREGDGGVMTHAPDMPAC